MTATSEDLRAALAGVVAIPVTPFAEDGTVDRAAHRALLRRLLDAGITTLTPNGNTGEFYALTSDERRLVTELTVEEAGERAAILVGVGHDVPTAVASARQARDLGAPMVMVHQPVHPCVSAGGWIDYHRAIAEAVPGLGVVPYIRNAQLPGARLAELADHCPNVIGVKYAVRALRHHAGPLPAAVHALSRVPQRGTGRTAVRGSVAGREGIDRATGLALAA